MPRYASMTEREAASYIGNANTAIINSENRSYACKWLVARGWKSRDAYTLSNARLQELYSEHGPNDFENIKNDEPVSNNAEKQLAELIRLIAGDNFKPVDESTVRNIVNQAINDANMPIVNTTKIEIKAPEFTKIIEGAVHENLSDIILSVSLSHPVMLIGPAGCGKTTIGKQVSEALNLDFFITHVVFDTHELMGFVDGHGKYHKTPFREAFEHGGIWVADEIDAWDASALLAANAALANGFCHFPDSEMPVKKHENFRVIATANTFGNGADRMYVGRNQLDAATLDRFATFDVDYSEQIEKSISTNNVWYELVIQVRNRINDLKIRHVVSTRAIVMGQQAIAAGMSFETAEKLYLFKGMSETDKKMIKGN